MFLGRNGDRLTPSRRGKISQKALFKKQWGWQ